MLLVVKVLIQTWDQDVKTHSDHSAFLKGFYVAVLLCSYVNLCKCTHRLPCSGKLRTVAGLPWVPILRVLVELNVSLLAGDDIGLRVTPVVGGSSPKRRRLALPAAGELYRSWTDNGEGGTSGREQIIKLIIANFLIVNTNNLHTDAVNTHLYVHCPGLTWTPWCEGGWWGRGRPEAGGSGLCW